MTPLSCDNCGACCMHMGTPPGYAAFFSKNSDRRSMLKMAERLTGIRWKDIPADDLPCLWLDLKTRKCKHYEWRPRVCREYERGEPSCHGARERIGITFNGVPVIPGVLQEAIQ